MDTICAKIHSDTSFEPLYYYIGYQHKSRQLKFTLIANIFYLIFISFAQTGGRRLGTRILKRKQVLCIYIHKKS